MSRALVPQIGRGDTKKKMPAQPWSCTGNLETC
jgi:hypothetical protein